VHEEKTMHVPYKYKALETRKMEERRHREKGRGETERKREQKTGEQKKNQRKRQPITKKHKSKGKNNILRKTITFISISTNHLRHRQVRSSFSRFVSAFFHYRRKETGRR
jgi:hypothetical protein